MIDERPEQDREDALPRDRRTLTIRVVAGLAPLVIVCASWLLHQWPDAVPAGEILQITRSRSFEGQPTLSPDGSVVAYRCDSRGNGDICIAAVDGREMGNLTAESLEDESEPAFSPDGRSIAFRSGRGGVFTVPREGGEIARLTATGSNPAWSPDGRSIVYADDGVPGRDLGMVISEGWIVDLDTKARRRISSVDFHQPAVSPHGTRIAYWGRPSDVFNRRRLTSVRGDLWTVAVAGGAPVRVTNDPAAETSPMWSPDGHFLYYVANRSGSSAIWRIAINERSGRPTGVPELVPTPYSQPAYVTRSADGRRFAWSDARPIERLLRVSFDADARRTRGSPVEIRPGDPEWEDNDTLVDLRVAAPATAGAPPAGTAFPGHWSPDGRLFAGTSAGGVWIYSAETRTYDQLRTGGGPVWLLDGRRLVFVSAGRLYMADAVLKISRELMAMPDQQLDAPRLSRDNRFLYFTSHGTDANVWVLSVK